MASNEPPSEPILVREQRGAILLLRLNRPEARNALSPSLVVALGDEFVAAETNPDVQCIVLTGTGDRAFCAGMDLRAFAAVGGSLDPKAMVTFERFAKGELTVPVVGAANATAVAGGFELLMGCDVVVASASATFGLPEVKRGLFAAGGGVLQLGARIPLPIALELTLTGDSIDAARAYELGLVNQVVPAEDVLDAAIAFAERIAGNGPLALQATRQLVRAASTDPSGAAALQAEWQPKVFDSNDAKEGAAAFIERRAPVWTGT